MPLPSAQIDMLVATLLAGGGRGSWRKEGTKVRDQVKLMAEQQQNLAEAWLATRDLGALERALGFAAAAGLAVGGERTEKMEPLRRTLQFEAELAARFDVSVAEQEGDEGRGVRGCVVRRAEQDHAAMQAIEDGIKRNCLPTALLPVLRSLRGGSLRELHRGVVRVADYGRTIAAKNATPSFFREQNLYLTELLPALVQILAERTGEYESHFPSSCSSGPWPTSTTTSSGWGKNPLVRISPQEVETATLRACHFDRRRLHNEIQDLKGAVRVYARIRPLSTAELAANGSQEQSQVSSGGASLVLVQQQHRGSAADRAGQEHQFEFDAVFGPQSSQVDVFRECADLVQSALDGYNVCIFTYGQTGGGKTFTLLYVVRINMLCTSTRYNCGTDNS